MGPIRGLKRKNKDEKKVDESASVVDASQLKPSDWWQDFSQRIAVHASPSTNANTTATTRTFESIFKMSRKTFTYICMLVREDMLAKTSQCMDASGRTLSIFDQVAVAIRRLGSGDSLSIVGDSFGMSPSTVSQLTWRFVEAMEERALSHLCWPETDAEMDSIKSKFERIRGLPNCCGAVDTTHVLMTLPASDDVDSKVWVDREENSSMVVQAVVDPEMRFRDVIAGWPGSLSDEDVMRSSGLFRLCEDGERLNGKHMRLGGGDDAEVGEYIVGDSGFPMLPWLVTPFRRRGGAEHRTEFNRRHSATRMVAQRALASLKETWRIIHGVMWKPDRHRLPRIVLVCCLLHNILIDMENDRAHERLSLSLHHDAAYSQQNCDSSDPAALLLREALSLHLASKSSLPSQN